MSAAMDVARASGDDCREVSQLAIAAVKTDGGVFSGSVEELLAVTEADWRDHCRPSADAVVLVVSVDLLEVGMVRVMRVGERRAVITDL